MKQADPFRIYRGGESRMVHGVDFPAWEAQGWSREPQASAEESINAQSDDVAQNAGKEVVETTAETANPVGTEASAEEDTEAPQTQRRTRRTSPTSNP
ncbi:hypothetical protein H6G00_00780 [Leptolyngbya sp. FACHB-541]|uniref:hypothetical protein n=1 Tax=Leptolyngbya sp. FACHB-541 TaxID=2692810 RepID=UPI00168604DD|nr:hypothetical protein [Leptolyngbya sp. FACHB-541]MBD1995162.1 hypothetical protein [Leptolyngbya sp. FACHB-541]